MHLQGVPPEIMDIHNFGEAFDFVMERLSQPGPFALVRFGDGESSILRKIPTGNREFQYQYDEDFHQALWDAFTYRDRDYYVGICCPCCSLVDSNFQIEFGSQDWDHVTFNNVFVNNNYKRIGEFVDLINDNDEMPILVQNTEGQTDQLPFPCEPFHVGYNAWHFWEDITEKFLDEHLQKRRDQMILVAAGPFSEVLIHQCFMKAPDNRYVDVGSIFDPWLFGKGTRGYHSSSYPTASKICHFRSIDEHYSHPDRV